MGNNINVILGSEGVCCLCSDLPHCKDCKKGDEPPPPGDPCDCNDYGAYNSPDCVGECNTACGEECQFAFPCPSVPELVAQGCYQCVSTCTCSSKGENDPGTDCESLGYDLSEEVQVSCGEDCVEISCIHCACYPCSEYGYVYCDEVETGCPSKKGSPVSPAPPSLCPDGCCTCDPVPEDECNCKKFGETDPGIDCEEFGYDKQGTGKDVGPCIDEEGNEFNIVCQTCECESCAANGYATSLDLCPDKKGDAVLPGTTSDVCPQGCWECDEPPGDGCGVCSEYGPPCQCCPEETAEDCGVACCCCDFGEAPMPIFDGGTCICVGG